MAMRRWTSQFSFSMERQAIRLMGAFTQSGSTGSFATLTSQGVTYTATIMGSAGNNITITITGGGTAGSEVVTVVGTSITVQVQSGVSTVTQVRTAVNASPAAAALVAATGTSSSTVSTHTAEHLATGTDTVFTTNTKAGTQQIPMSLAQIGTGKFQITMTDSYASLLCPTIMLQKATTTDAMPQIQSADVTTAKQITFVTAASGTATDLVSGDTLYISLELRNNK